MKKEAYGTYEIAKICRVTPPTVGRWVEDGKLPSFTTGGGHRRVWAADLVAFLNEHHIPIPDDLSDTKPASNALKVLIVDDESETRRLITRLLQQINETVEIHEAGDGFEAGHKVASLIPHLVVLDIRLPGVDGLKVCKMIRDDDNLKNTRILTISAHDPEASKQQSIDAGADDFMAKPFNINDFAAKIKELIPSIAKK
ncbi:response regulator [Elusimicrobiota bacterium]